MKSFVRLSVLQLFTLLFISRMIINVTYSSYTSDTESLKYGAVAGLIALPLTLIMTIPVYIMLKTNDGRTVTDNAYDLFKKWGAIIAVVYGLYFLWILISTLSQFNVMVTNVLNPTASVFVLSIAVVVASMYGAYKGIEALGRASTIIFMFIIVALIMLVCTLIPKVDTLNYVPITTEATSNIFNITTDMLAKNSCIPAMAILLPVVKGKAKGAIIWWSIAVYATTAIFILLITGVLGDFLQTQVFPVYTLTAVASLGVTERLDGLFLGVWTAGMFVRISLYIYLLSACVKRIFGEVISRWSILICGVLVLFTTMGITVADALFNFVLNSNLLLILTLITGVVIPLFIALFNKIKKSKIAHSES